MVTRKAASEPFPGQELQPLQLQNIWDDKKKSPPCALQRTANSFHLTQPGRAKPNPAEQEGCNKTKLPH